MANILKKPWKDRKIKKPSNPINWEKRKQIRTEEKQEAQKMRDRVKQIKDKKRKYFEEKRLREEQKKASCSDNKH
ncbi:hypothetical protein CWI38_2504p0010 [Hamiltosporidium tvaerminnensis]|uniref:Uncharacterized protein n=1 Tax=Hamiltosporidium tvaerminnensis TaxID=1176355 RepID=A0A4Q9LFK2_9MICR|nr:hypothetical protein CWI38_2504p0010 [Hamiltosporidium tvaerminnensis]